MITQQQFWLLAAVAVCAASAAIDLRTRTIPNWLTLGMLGASPLVHAGAALVRERLWAAALAAAVASVGGAVVSGLLPALMYRSGGLGLGDVKLFAAVGAACGPLVGLYAQTYAYVAAMVLALLLAAHRGKVRTTLSNVRKVLAGARPVAAGSEASSPGDGFTEIALGPAIFIGMCAAAWARWRAG